MTGNKFSSDSLLSLKELLQGQSNVEGVALCNCFEPSIVSICFALKFLIEGLSKSSSCGFIDLSANSFDSSHIYYIILLLRACPQIYLLELRDNHLSGTMSLFSRAIALTTLQSLDLSNCNIHDHDLIILGRGICTTQLHSLSILCNPFTDKGLSIFLKLFVSNVLSVLTILRIDRHANEDHMQILKKINHFRASIRLNHMMTMHKSEYTSHSKVQNIVDTTNDIQPILTLNEILGLPIADQDMTLEALQDQVIDFDEVYQENKKYYHEELMIKKQNNKGETLTKGEIQNIIIEVNNKAKIGEQRVLHDMHDHNNG